jgi:hypothetical protein
MSEKIQNIMRECFIPIGDSEYDMEKFAKLLILNCAYAAEMASYTDIDCPEIYIIEQMGLGEEHGAVNWYSENRHLVEYKVLALL